ncbi:FAD-dependent oxidoreductase [Mucilaginibacter endophyticus]|uniref:FAD-dependent oxidoreductase n=1 Tax=Mucilaginibacter endophyticus TaxID=2675003 RepID=UPI000E0D9FD0|nr:NAD(P)/FAD-dependent oxidoreductase [Mucilaginibacter endophyticus]
MKAIKNKNIAIVGGGPGGLTLARILQMNGANVKVYERDLNREVRVQGATLDLHEESGLKALEVAGLMDAFNANYRPGADKLRVVDKYANIIHDEHGADGGSYNRPEIDRGPLRKILLDSLQPDTVVWDSQFVSLDEQDGKIKLDFKNGSTARADLVIAADGANSKIRPYITPIKPFYAGVSVIEGAVYDSEKASPRVHELLNGGKIFAMGDEKTLIVSSKGDGSLVFYAGIKSTETWLQDSGIDFKDKASVFAWFKQEFTGWDNIWDELFENAEPVFIPRPQYCMPLDQTWEALPNITMLGDAAHLMPPYAGEGVNMAMLDALELAQHLLNNEFENTRDAIAAYEKTMRARASETAAMTLEQTDSLHSADGLKNLVAMFNPEG